MNINELFRSGTNVTVSILLNDLRDWHREVIEDTRRELEQAVLSDKAEKYLSPNQVSEMLNVDLTTLWRWSKKSYLVPIEFGGKRKYRLSEIKKILNEGRAK